MSYSLRWLFCIMMVVAIISATASFMGSYVDRGVTPTILFWAAFVCAPTCALVIAIWAAPRRKFAVAFAYMAIWIALFIVAGVVDGRRGPFFPSLKPFLVWFPQIAFLVLFGNLIFSRIGTAVSGSHGRKR
jgi:hypothetical protein